MKRTLFALAGGAAVQKVILFLVSLLLARNLGVEGLGDYAFGVQLGMLLALFPDVGVRVVAAREAAARPLEAPAWIRASLEARLFLSAVIYALYLPAVLLAEERPGFLLVCGLLVFPMAFDMKGLADALGQASKEVFWEGGAAFLYMGGTAALCYWGKARPETLAWVLLASRLLYAGFAWSWVRRLGRGGGRIAPAGLLRLGGGLSAAIFLNNLVRAIDVILLKLLAGPYQAGLYSAARKLAAAGEAPMVLLSRLFRPHLDRAAAVGDRAGTLARTLRAQAFLVLPVAAGGWLTAEPLLSRLFGEGFRPAGWTLKWLLAVLLLAGLGSALGNTLFASRRHREYVLPLLLATALNLGLTLLLIPAYGSSGAAFATVVSFAAAVPLSAYFLLRQGVRIDLPGVLARPCAAACVVAAAVLAAPADWDVLFRVGAGVLAWAVAVWALEFRGRWRALGKGLQEGSRFGLERGERSGT